MLRTKFIIFFCFCYHFGQTQGIYNSLKDSTKLASQYDSIQVFFYGEQAIKEAKKINSLSKEAEILKIYGEFYYYSSKKDKAIYYFAEAKAKAKKDTNLHLVNAIELRERLTLQNKTLEQDVAFILETSKARNDTVIILESLNILANTKNKHNKRDEAFAYYLEALKMAEKSNNNYFTKLLYNNIGLLKWENGQTEEALADFKTALHITEKLPNIRLNRHLNNNIGLIYARRKEYEKAIKFYKNNLSILRKTEASHEAGIRYMNIGNSFYNLKKYKIALLYYDSSITIFTKNDFITYLPRAYIGRSAVNLALKQMNSAEKDIEIGMKIAQKKHLLADLALGHNVLFNLAKKRNNYKLALEEYQQYKKLNDSIIELSNKKTISELQIQYGVSKKEIELTKERDKTRLLEQEKKIEALRFKTLIITSIVTIILVMVLLLIRHYRKTNRQQELFSQNLIENIDKERERIAKDLHDDLGQRMSIIKNKIYLTQGIQKKELSELESELGMLIESTRNISHELHPSFLTKIGLEKSIKQLFKEIESSSDIVCSYDFMPNLDDFFNLEEKTHLYRITQECINNTLKHAKASALKITITKSNTHLKYIYRDNGIGFSEDLKKKSMGLMNMNERIKILNGSMVIAKSSRSMKIIFEFKPTSFK